MAAETHQATDRTSSASGDAVWIDATEAHGNLTRAQFLIWMGQKLDPKSPLYNMIFAFHLEGSLDRNRFSHAFDRLVAECDALRITIGEQAGIPVQNVSETAPRAIEQVDLSELENPVQAFSEWLDERKGRLHVIDRCLYDSALVRLSPVHHVWYFNQHHLISDAWSTALLCRRLRDHYEAVENGVVPGTFIEYAQRERAGRGRTQVRKAADFFRSQVENAAPPVAFYGRAAANPGTRTHRIRRPLGRARSRHLRLLAESAELRLLNSDLSLFRIFATMVLAFLRRIGADDLLTLGIPVHNRVSAADKNTPGLFMEVLPMNVTTSNDSNFDQLLQTTGTGIMRLLGNAVAGISTAASNTAYDVLLNFVTARMPIFTDLALTPDWVHAGAGDRAQKLRLQIHDFRDAGELCVDFDFNLSAFDMESATLAIDHFFAVVDAFLADRTQALSGIDLFRPGERQRQVVDFNRTAVNTIPDRLVNDGIAAQVAARPDAIALRCGDVDLSYRELDRRVDCIAAQLQAAGFAPGKVAVLLMERSIEAVVAILATLRTGAAYVPLDPRHPPQRLAGILADLAESDLDLVRVLVHDQTTGLIPPDIPFFRVQADPDASAAPVPLSPAADGLAYVIYTSGSTGTPKGVQITHAALANYVCWARHQYCGDQPAAFALHTSLAVDLTVTSLFVPLTSGGSVVIYPDRSDNDLPVLKVFEEDAVDVLKLTPAHLALIRELGGRASRIRTLILGGEDLKTDLVRSVLPQFPDALAVYNEYGPTEATVGCMIHRFDPETDVGRSVPIGHPIANAAVYVLDAAGNPVPTGLTGELFIGGAGIARGYLNRPALNARHFVAGPAVGAHRLYRTGDLARWDPQGGLAYLGRGDDQVKIRGTRIELGDVEAALAEHPGIRACVATVIDAGDPQRIRTCARCGMPSNYPGVVFDDHDVCSMCLAYDRFEDQAQSYFGTATDLEALAGQMREQRRGDYDCIVLLSGGKDSTYMIYQVVRLGLKVLALTLDNGFISAGALENVRRTAAHLGIDHKVLTTPHMNGIFADSLERYSNVCHGCFKTIYTLSMLEARERDIGFIVTGLSRGQIFETRLNDLFRHRVFDVASIESAILEARKVYHRVEDAVARALPVNLFADDSIFEQVRFVDFYRYRDVPLTEVYRFLAAETAWRRPADTGRSTNCLINDAGIYVHRKERGFHNYALPYSWDVRLGHKSRADALYELDDEIDLRRVRNILDDIGYQEKPARNEARLAVYYTGDRALPAAALRAHIADRLPEEMLPAHYVHLPALPVARTGKVDRRALPEPADLQGVARTEYVAPSTDIEKRLAEIWSELLNVAKIGAHDNFFDLGGMSLTAIQALSRIRAGFDVELPVQSFFRAPTVSDVSLCIEEQLVAQIEALSDEEVQRLLDADTP